jgi:uncharacterized membrane protein YidH (DUF202 family)
MIINVIMLAILAIGTYLTTGIMYWHTLKKLGHRDKYIIYIWPLIGVYLVVAGLIDLIWEAIKEAWTRLRKQTEKK